MNTRVLPYTGVFRISQKCKKRLCRKFGHVMRLAWHKKIISRDFLWVLGPHHFFKVGLSGPKKGVFDVQPSKLKYCKNGQNFAKNLHSWACWVGKTSRKVVGWVVRGGAPWGGGKGVKLAKIEVLMEVVVKNDKNSKCWFFWSKYVVTWWF